MSAQRNTEGEGFHLYLVANGRGRSRFPLFYSTYPFGMKDNKREFNQSVNHLALISKTYIDGQISNEI